jgi:hypothetical protein
MTQQFHWKAEGVEELTADKYGYGSGNGDGYGSYEIEE